MSQTKALFVYFGSLIFSATAFGGIVKTETLEEFSNGRMTNLSFANDPTGKLTIDTAFGGVISVPLNFARLPLPLSKFASIEVGGRLYVIGGVTLANIPRKEIYSVKIANFGIDGNNWRTETVLPQGLVNPSVLFLNGKMVVIPSVNGQDIFSTSLNKDDGILGSWTTIGKLPTGVQQNSSVVIGQRLFLAMSDGSGKTFSVSFSPDGHILNWRPEENIPINLSGFSLVSHMDRAYLLGGFNNLASATAGVFSIKANLDGSIGSWVSELSLPVGLAYHSAVISRDLLVVSGGTTGSVLSNNMYSASIDHSGQLYKWKKEFASLPFLVKNHNSIVGTNACLLVLGGETDTSLSDKLISFSFYKLPLFNSPSVVGGVNFDPLLYKSNYAATNKRLYYIVTRMGGEDKQPALYSIELSETGNLSSTPRAEILAVVPDPYNLNVGQLYVMGGRLFFVADYYNTAAKIFATTLKEDGTIGGWYFVGDGPRNVKYFMTMFVGNRLYFIGGYDRVSKSIQNTVYSSVIDENGNKGPWFPEVALPSGVQSAGIVLCKDRMILCGGASPGLPSSPKVYSATFNSDGRIKSWDSYADLPIGLYYPNAVAVDNHIFLIGGATNGILNKKILTSRLDESSILTPWTTFVDNLNVTTGRSDIFSCHGSMYYIEGISLNRCSTPRRCLSGAVFFSKVIDLISVRNLFSLAWNRLVNPSNTSMAVSLASTPDQESPLDSFTEVVNGLNISKLARFVQLQFRFKSNDGTASPGLDDFTITHYSDSTHPDGAPVLSMVNVTTSSLTVSLQDRSVGEEAFQFFLSRTSPPSGDPIQYASVVGSSGTTTTYTFNELLHGTTYYLRARGWNAADSIDGAYSNLISIQTPSLDLKRRLSTELLGLDSVIIGWPQVDNAIEYRVFDEGNNLLATKSSSTLSFTETVLSPNTQLFRRIEASDSIGVIQVGSVVLYTGLAAPLATDFLIESQGDNWINIQVNPPLNAASGLSGTKIILRSEGMIIRTARLKNKESTYRFESLPVGKKYQITTSYLNGDGIESMESPVLETFVGLASESFTPAKEKFRISDGIEFPIESNVPIQGSLKIYDSQQRLLREIPIDSPAGHSAVRWDGRDDNGNPVFSGIYWAVSETDHFGRKTFKVAGIR